MLIQLPGADQPQAQVERGDLVPDDLVITITKAGSSRPTPKAAISSTATPARSPRPKPPTAGPRRAVRPGAVVRDRHGGTAGPAGRPSQAAGPAPGRHRADCADALIVAGSRSGRAPGTPSAWVNCLSSPFACWTRAGASPSRHPSRHHPSGDPPRHQRPPHSQPSRRQRLAHRRQRVARQRAFDRVAKLGFPSVRAYLVDRLVTRRRRCGKLRMSLASRPRPCGGCWTSTRSVG
jgi:hypothetical protein